MDQDLLRSIYLKIRHVNDVSIKNYEELVTECSATGVQFGVLRNISVEKTTTMSDLVQKVKCAASNMTALIQRMERDGLVKTIKNPEDKRETLVVLTEKGQTARNEMEPRYHQFLEQSFGRLTPEEQLILNTLLAKLEENMTSK